MNLKIMFATQLKDWVANRYPVEQIGNLAFSFYWEHIQVIELDFVEILLTLNTMADGPEFAFSYEKLEQIADDLIAGKEVKF